MLEGIQLILFWFDDLKMLTVQVLSLIHLTSNSILLCTSVTVFEHMLFGGICSILPKRGQTYAIQKLFICSQMQIRCRKCEQLKSHEKFQEWKCWHAKHNRKCKWNRIVERTVVDRWPVFRTQLLSSIYKAFSKYFSGLRVAHSAAPNENKVDVDCVGSRRVSAKCCSTFRIQCAT